MFVSKKFDISHEIVDMKKEYQNNWLEEGTLENTSFEFRGLMVEKLQFSNQQFVQMQTKNSSVNLKCDSNVWSTKDH